MLVYRINRYDPSLLILSGIRLSPHPSRSHPLKSFKYSKPAWGWGRYARRCYCRHVNGIWGQHRPCEKESVAPWPDPCTTHNG